MAFQFDTSGAVHKVAWREGSTVHCANVSWDGSAPGTTVALSPFVQGYVEALFASGVRPCEPCCGNGEIIIDEERYLKPLPGDVGDEGTADCPNCGGRGVLDLGAFSDLAPETLAQIMEDCERFTAGLGKRGLDPRLEGEQFWIVQQRGGWKNFPPAPPYLGDDGKVYLRPAI